MIIKLSLKILQKEKGKLFLPFFSILLTSCVVILSYFLISASSAYLLEKNKEFIGGDVAIESAQAFSIERYFNEDQLERVTRQVTFQGLVSSRDKASGVDFTFVDPNFPLYGKVVLESGDYVYPNNNEIYIDESLKESLDVTVGDTILFNDRPFAVKGVVVQNPESVLGGFSFSPNVILSQGAIAYSQIDLDLFRKEYKEKAILRDELSADKKASLRETVRRDGARANFDGGAESGLQFGLEIVENFLVVVIIVIIILALVNIYSAVSFLAERLRRSFAILMSLGMSVDSVYKVLLLVNSVVIFLGILFGGTVSYILNNWIVGVIRDNVQVDLSTALNPVHILGLVLLIYVTSICATLPVANKLRSLSPKELLANSGNRTSGVYKNIFKDILFGLFPVALISVYFLDSVVNGLIVVGSIMLAYGVVMILYSYVIKAFYAIRASFPFFIRLIISQKKFDGFLGLVTFASLFIALTAVFNLSVLRTSINEYLQGNLRDNVPSVYVLDVQKSQVEKFKSMYPDSTLFPNVRARLVSVDGLDIQKELEKEEPALDREFAREFNLTFRDYFLESEVVIEGSSERVEKGGVSLEEDFARRLGAGLGSTLVLNIQGFKLEVVVTSIRSVDTRSGLPFFFLVFSPEDLEQYPNTSFGYLNIPTEEVSAFSKQLSLDFPNVSVIDTSRVTDIAQDITELLLIVILIITVPPIILSTLLIINIIAIMSKDRKRDGARLMALGKTNAYVRNFFIFESTVTLILSSVAAYTCALLVSNYLIIRFLKINNTVFFDLVSSYIFISLLGGVVGVSVIMWIKGSRSIKNYLNYEENN